MYSTWKELSIDMLDLIYHDFILVFISFLKSSKTYEPSRKSMDSFDLGKRNNHSAIKKQ